MFKKIAMLLPLALCTLPAAAASDGFLDVYYVPSVQSKIGSGDVSDNGHGFGAKFTQPLFGPTFVVTGQFQRDNLDGGHIDQYRIGGGVQSSPDRARLLAYGEYVRDQLKSDSGGSGVLDGFGVHARVTWTILEPLDIYGEAGYVRLTLDSHTFDGPEFTVGAVFNFTQQLGAFADYRITRTDTNGDDKARFYETRVGLRLNF